MVQISSFDNGFGGKALVFAPDSMPVQANIAIDAATVQPKSVVSITRQDLSGYDLKQVAQPGVKQVLGRSRIGTEAAFKVQFDDGYVCTVTARALLEIDRGDIALSRFLEGFDLSSEQSGSESSVMAYGGEVADFASATDSSKEKAVTRSLRQNLKRKRGAPQTSRATRRSHAFSRHESVSPLDDDSEHEASKRSSSRRLSTKQTNQRSLARQNRQAIAQNVVDQSDSDTDDSKAEDSDGYMPRLNSDITPRTSRKHRHTAQRTSTRIDPQVSAVRKSNRSTRNIQSMREPGVEDVYRSDENKRPAIAKTVNMKELFKPLPAGNVFKLTHMQQCEKCGRYGTGPQGDLVFCQGCTLAYHQLCLDSRSTREHIVTKVGEEDFVLQCRRCVRTAQRKHARAPDQSMCQGCRKPGPACRAFRERRTPAQEEKEREQNGGIDPIVPIDTNLLNNASNVLFRCVSCWRASHFHHLPATSDAINHMEADEYELHKRRFAEYNKTWECIDCSTAPAKFNGLIAWRPLVPDVYLPGMVSEDMNEDDKEYLIKWEHKSYFQAQWKPGAWVWGKAAPAMLKAFTKRETNDNPCMTTEDAIPEEWLRIDIVLDIKFTSKVDTQSEEVDKARVREVDMAFCKYKGLTYEESVWEKPPKPDDGDRWTDFVKAYHDWVMGRHVRYPKGSALRLRTEKARAQAFTALEKKKQPTSLTGGELMQYQLDGLNWLYYKWYSRENGILADEMGLGKTIQIIGLLATLVEEHQCYPFLIVVPNSTCANWRRELQKWAAPLRAVTYFGSAEARALAYRYELFPESSSQLKCHVVITSYDAAVDDSCQKFFRSVSWQGLVVDEGQRLKNENNLLYTALSKLNIPFKILLTGTPLQNNARELFNLLQFLDKSFDAAKLELEYSKLTKENVPQLHNLIRPFFLRRTKAQVLDFLPPMAQIILPVSMSAVQSKLYKSILSKNPDLIRAIFDPSRRGLAKGERASLNNLLMQLRKCLCHPFVYSKEIEERGFNAAVSHRNLVEASGKLQVLEILLLKLKEKGHRVLIFSQFLDMLDIVEDFLDGLQLQYHRLDGTISSLQKQKRIDEFNAPESPFFAFLLSTRAGGVGINLATADTVIIMDPDFNPHQDIQALSRAHRIGQQHKVLCFQLMTRSSAEERIMQIGRKKMALDHVLIEQMETDEHAEIDVDSILRFGAAEILEGTAEVTRYDEASIEKLLDRSQIESTKSGEDHSAESQFSFARVWANDQASMVDSMGSDDEQERAPNAGVWDDILRERELLATKEAASRIQNLGRGKRARNKIQYEGFGDDHEPDDSTSRRHNATGSDTDFQANDRDSSSDNDHDREKMEDEDLSNLQDREDSSRGREGLLPNDINRGISKIGPEVITNNSIYGSPSIGRSGHHRMASGDIQAANQFQRVIIDWKPQSEEIADSEHPVVQCKGCGAEHRRGFCPLKIAGFEHCNLCGIAHFGIQRSCPHIRSETQVRNMLQALKQSPESRNLIDIATKYLAGVKGSIVQEKKKKEERAAKREAGQQVRWTAPSREVPVAQIQDGPRIPGQVDNLTSTQGKIARVTRTVSTPVDGFIGDRSTTAQFTAMLAKDRNQTKESQTKLHWLDPSPNSGSIARNGWDDNRTRIEEKKGSSDAAERPKSTFPGEQVHQSSFAEGRSLN